MIEFSPFNNVVQHCLQGMEQESLGNKESALQVLFQGWEMALDDYEKFLTAYFVARHQEIPSERLKWFQTALMYILKVDHEGAKSALPGIYEQIAHCFQQSGDSLEYHSHLALSMAAKNRPPDTGPFFHGTKATLKVGDELTPGGISNYQEGLTMNHIYFTAQLGGAKLAAALAKGEGKEHVYVVHPTGSFEADPNLTDKKFPGNPTRSYRSLFPLKITGEVMDTDVLTPENIEQFKQKLKQNSGDIIND